MKTQQTWTIEAAIEAGHDENDAPRVVALCQFLNCSPEDVSRERYDHYDMPVFYAEGGEYAVATDEEAEEAWDQCLDSYIDECIEPEVERARKAMGGGVTADYLTFDREGWKDAAQQDGRGHSLSSYDGNEEEETVGAAELGDKDGYDETFYIYRTN